jgi:orc1/cdc6 family replication initiation protein
MGFKIIKDQRPISFDYVPEEIPHREKMLASAESIIGPVLEGGYTTCLFTGPVGTGKTLVALKLEERVREMARGAKRDVKVIHINCRISSTESMILTQVLRSFDPFFREKGTSFEEKVMHLASLLETKRARMLVVLDEVGYSYSSLDKLIYVLLRFHEYTRRENPISLILISSKPVYELFDASIRSIFKKNMLKFPPYSSPELLDILRSRAGLALADRAIDEDALALIADIAASKGDARRAIEILDISAHAAEAEGPRILAEHVRAAAASIEPSLGISDFDRMPLHSLLVLLGLSRDLRKKAETTTGAARLAYMVACEEFNVKPRGQTQYWKYMQRLKDLGMISTRGSSKEKRGKTTMIGLRDVPASALETIITTMLKERGERPDED